MASGDAIQRLSEGRPHMGPLCQHFVIVAISRAYYLVHRHNVKPALRGPNSDMEQSAWHDAMGTNGGDIKTLCFEHDHHACMRTALGGPNASIQAGPTAAGVVKVVPKERFLQAGDLRVLRVQPCIQLILHSSEP